MSGFGGGENRHQTTLLPQSLDEYVSEADLIRFVDLFIGALVQMKGIENVATEMSLHVLAYKTIAERTSEDQSGAIAAEFRVFTQPGSTADNYISNYFQVLKTLPMTALTRLVTAFPL